MAKTVHPNVAIENDRRLVQNQKESVNGPARTADPLAFVAWRRPKYVQDGFRWTSGLTRLFTLELWNNKSTKWTSLKFMSKDSNTDMVQRMNDA